MSNVHPPFTWLPVLRRAILASLFACLLLTVFTASVEAASISGRVTNQYGEPLEEIGVRLYAFTNGNWNETGNITYTGFNGDYSLSQLAPGTYRLQFDVFGENYIGEFYNNQNSVQSATDLVLANANVALTGIDATLAATFGRIVGKVLDPDNHPIANVEVSVWRDAGEGLFPGFGTYTDNAGEFMINAFNGDPHRLKFTAYSVAYVDEYYDNQYDLESADLVTVQPNEMITLTVTLSRTKTISGTVTDNQGGTVAAIIKLYKMAEDDSWSFWADTYPGPYGLNTYRFEGLSPGKYRLEFAGNTIIPEYYDNKSIFGQAEILNLTGSPDFVVANATLARRGTITGTVADRHGNPLQNIEVLLYYEENGDWLVQDSELTNSNGNYTLRQAMPNRDYRIRFVSSAYHFTSPYVAEYYDDVATIEAARIITVPAETTIPNINAQLESYGIITGVVTGGNGEPLANVTVQSYDRTTEWAIRNTTTDEEGYYSLSLQPGMEFSIGFAHATHEAEFYDDQPTIAAGIPVTAPVNGVTPNINAQLIPGPVISGTVTDNKGTPLAGIVVVAFSEYQEIKATVLTDANGHYAVSLASGTYRLAFNTYNWEAENENYVLEYYENAATFAEATSIILTYGNDLIINAELAIVPSISGRVTTYAGEGTYAEIGLLKRVEIDGKLQWECCVRYTTTGYNEDGYYRLANLEPGEYLVHFQPDYFQSLYLAEYYPNQRTAENATILTITEHTILTDINAVLDSPGKVVGTVVNNKNQPLSGINVTLHFPSSLSGDHHWPPTIPTDENGHFVFKVGEDSQWLLFHDPTGQYATEFYDNQFNLESATEIGASPNSTMTIKVELGPSASITGHVTNLAGQPLANVDVRLYTYWPQHYQQWQHVANQYTETDANGNYRIDGASPGTKYRISFNHDFRNYIYPHSEPVAEGIGAEQGTNVVIPAHLPVLPNINMRLAQPGEVYAEFTGTPRTGIGSLTTNFTDQSLGTVNSRLWDFGDGFTSTQTNPSHTYTTPGIYTVTLTVSGTAHSESETKIGYISLFDSEITGLGIQLGNSNTQPKVGQTLYFSATGTGSNIQYLWDFGDPTEGAIAGQAIASGQFVQHSYHAPGTYTINLSARNGADQKVATMLITIVGEGSGDQPVSALALHGPSRTRINSSVTLSATVAAGDNVSYSWNFGDGETGTGQVVSHTYAAAGTYTVTLTASNGAGAATVTSAIIVEHEWLLPWLER